jgi:tetratricopeptide (TPR) repeat protein
VTFSDPTEMLVRVLVTSTDFEQLLWALRKVPSREQTTVGATLEDRAQAAARAGHPAEAELLAFLATTAQRVWGAEAEGGHRAFASLLTRAARTNGLFDAFLVFRRYRAELPDDPVAVAVNLLTGRSDIAPHEQAAVLAALGMADGRPRSVAQARTWWALSLMSRGSFVEKIGQADSLGSRYDRRRAMFHATRAVEGLLATGSPEQDVDLAYWTYETLARAHRGLGDFRTGLRVLLECEAQLRAADDNQERWMRFDSLMGTELSTLGLHHAATRHFSQALLACHEVTGDHWDAFQADVLIERGKNHLVAGTLAAATEDLRQATDIAERLQLIEPAFRARALLANTLNARGRQREALRIFEENLAVALREGTLQAHGLRGGLAGQLYTMGHLKEAEEQYRLALEEIRSQPTGSRNEITCMSGLGQIAEARGDHDEALDWFQRGYQASSTYRRKVDGLVPLAGALTRRLQRDRSPAAAQPLLPLLGGLLQEARADGDPVAESVTANALIICLSNLDQWEEAANLGRYLIADADHRQDSSDGHMRRLAFVKTFRSRPELRTECLKYLWWYRNTALQQITGTPLPALRAEACGEALPAYEALLDLLLDHGGNLPLPDGRPVPELCFDLHEEVRARDLLADLAHTPLPAPPEVPAPLIEEEHQLLKTVRTDLTRSLLGPLAPLTSASTDMFTRLTTVQTAMGSHAPDYVRLRQGAPIRLAEARALLEEDAPAEGMILASYFCGTHDTYCFVLTSDGQPVRMHRIPLSRSQIEAASQRLRVVFNGGLDTETGILLRPLPGRRPGKRDAPVLAPVLTELALLLEPFADLLTERKLVAIAPHGPLSNVPFAALPLPSGQRLGESHATVYLPGVSSLQYLMAHPATPPRTAVTVGCAGREDDTELFERDHDLLADGPWQSAPPLPGLKATPAAVRSALASAELAHIAAHGYADPDDPLDSALLLSDGRTRPSSTWEAHNLPANARYLLRVRDVTADSMAPSRLVLRACSAGWSDPDHPGTDLAGLTWAFLRSGSRCVIAPRWDVDQESSRTLLASFYRHLGAGEPAWRALWRAQRELAEDTARPWLSHFYHWSAFTLTGDWR